MGAVDGMMESLTSGRNMSDVSLWGPGTVGGVDAESIRLLESLARQLVVCVLLDDEELDTRMLRGSERLRDPYGRVVVFRSTRQTDLTA